MKLIITALTLVFTFSSFASICSTEIIRHGKLRSTITLQDTYDYATKAQALVWEDHFKVDLDTDCYVQQVVKKLTTDTGKKFTFIQQYEGYCMLNGRTAQGIILDENLDVVVELVNDTYYCR